MRIIRDFQNCPIRLTQERLAHILDHPEMKAMTETIAKVLAAPEMVVQSASDHQARLYYRYFFDTPVGDKYLCVVVKSGTAGTFVLTAYLTDAVKKGALLWPRKP